MYNLALIVDHNRKYSPIACYCQATILRYSSVMLSTPSIRPSHGELRHSLWTSDCNTSYHRPIHPHSSPQPRIGPLHGELRHSFVWVFLWTSDLTTSNHPPYPTPSPESDLLMKTSVVCRKVIVSFDSFSVDSFTRNRRFAVSKSTD